MYVVACVLLKKIYNNNKIMVKKIKKKNEIKINVSMTHGTNGFLFNFFYHYFIIIIFFMYVFACVLLKKIYNNNKIMVKKIKIKKLN